MHGCFMVSSGSRPSLHAYFNLCRRQGGTGGRPLLQPKVLYEACPYLMGPMQSCSAALDFYFVGIAIALACYCASFDSAFGGRLVLWERSQRRRGDRFAHFSGLLEYCALRATEAPCPSVRTVRYVALQLLLGHTHTHTQLEGTKQSFAQEFEDHSVVAGDHEACWVPWALSSVTLLHYTVAVQTMSNVAV